MALLEVVDPVALVLGAVRVVEGSLTVSEALLPVADVPVSEELVIRVGLQPDVGSKAALEVVLPVSGVLLVAGEPVHDSVAVTLVVLPLTLVVVSTGVGHLSFAPFHSSLPLTLVDGAVFVGKLSVTVAHSFVPLALVFNSLFSVDVLALSVAEAVEYVALVVGAIGPLISALTGDFILFELTLVDGSISPLELALSMKKTVNKFSFVFMAVFKLAGALTVVDFANLIKLAGEI